MMTQLAQAYQIYQALIAGPIDDGAEPPRGRAPGRYHVGHAQTISSNALEAVIEDAHVAADQAPAVYLPTDMAAVDTDPTSRLPVTVVPAGALAPTPTWLQPRRHGRRSLVAGFDIA